MVRGDAALEVLAPLPVAQDAEVLVLEGTQPIVDDRADLIALGRVSQPHTGTAYLLDGGLATHAAEDEEDRRSRLERPRSSTT